VPDQSPHIATNRFVPKIVCSLHCARQKAIFLFHSTTTIIEIVHQKDRINSTHHRGLVALVVRMFQTNREGWWVRFVDG